MHIEVEKYTTDVVKLAILQIYTGMIVQVHMEHV